MKKFHQIPDLPNYRINKNGECAEAIDGMVCKMVEPIIFDGNVYGEFVVNGETKTLKIADLVVRTFYGIHHAPYYFVDGDRLNTDSVNLRYKINIDHIDEEYAIIDGIEFKHIPRSQGFYISQGGMVFNRRYKRFSKSSPSYGGYLRHSILYENDINAKMQYTHLLVYRTWIGTVPKGYVIDHLDGNRWHPDLSNLECVTISENNFRAKSGPHPVIWSKETIRFICENLAEGKSSGDVARMLEVDAADRSKIYSLCHELRIGKRWKNISKDFTFPDNDPNDNKFKVHPDSIVTACKRLHDKGMSNVEIGNLLGIPRQTVYGYTSDRIRK